MSAGHFFVGLGAGIAILAIPVATLTPGLNAPQRFAAWINGPPPNTTDAQAQTAAVTRPLSGYKPGDPTPTVEPPPAIQPLVSPTRPPAVQPTPPPAQPLSDLRWQGTGVIRSGGIPVYVRRVVGVDSRDDPTIADGSPVLVSTAPPMQIGAQQWRAIRGLNGIVGWVPSAQVAVDGEAPPQPLTVGIAPTPTQTAAGTDRGMIANTDGVGVVLRNSPNDADRSRSGLMDGMRVTVLADSGTNWLQVRADNGQTGWIPAQYVIAAG